MVHANHFLMKVINSGPQEDRHEVYGSCNHFLVDGAVGDPRP